MKKCLVNFVTSELRYLKAQDRLIERMKGQDIPLISWRGGAGLDMIKAPSHKSNPFAFKIYAIEAARQMGFEQVFWVDSSVYPVHNIDPIFKRLDECGIFLEDSGHYVSDWAEDKVLEYFGLKRKQTVDLKMLSAGFIGLDFTRDESIEFFSKWAKSMQDGMFKGDTVKYRNEMCCASIIANQMELHTVYSDAHAYFCYVGEQYGEPNPEAPFHLQGY